MGSWFPSGRNNDNGWRLDVVSLLAVIGESAIAEHAQVMTASRLAFLPRLIPAPQVLLRPSRPSRMPQASANVVGVFNGTLLQSLNYFPNIIHPIESLPAFAFRVYEIRHNPRKIKILPPSRSDTGDGLPTENGRGGRETDVDTEAQDLSQPPSLKRRKTLKQTITPHSYDPYQLAPLIPPSLYSPLNILSIFSFLLTLALFIWAVIIEDGVACVALGTISLVSSVVGYASYWKPKLKKRLGKVTVPRGDTVIRTREGAFIVVKCDEDVARELYMGTEECTYKVGTLLYRGLVGFGTFLLMISVVLLGNCNWTMQAAIGVSYILLNGLYWAVSIVPKNYFWDMDLYDFSDITPADARDADKVTQPPEGIFDESDLEPDDLPSYTRTLWYAIRETQSTAFANKAGFAPMTDNWLRWLAEADLNKTNKNWKAVLAKDRIVGIDPKQEGKDMRVSVPGLIEGQRASHPPTEKGRVNSH